MTKEAEGHIIQTAMKIVIIAILSSASFCVFLACTNPKTRDKEFTSSSGLISDSIRTLDSLAKLFLIQDNALANAYISKAIDLSRKTGSNELLIKSLNIKGLLMSNDQYDSAFYYYSWALNMSDSIKNFSEKAFILYNLARLYSLANDQGFS